MIEYYPDQKKTDNFKEKRGDLYVKFQIIFPERVSAAQKEKLKVILNS